MCTNLTVSTARFLRSVELVVTNYCTTVHIILQGYSGSHLWPTWSSEPQIIPDMTYTWPTFDPHAKDVFKSNAKSHGKFLEKCHRFLHSWNHSYEWNLWILHFKTAWSVKLVLHQWWLSAFLRPKVHLLIKCQCLF